MAKVEWSTGIDHVSGALSKPSKSGQHSCTKMLLGTHRVAESTSKDCNRLYLRKPTVRTSPLSASEVAVRQKFTAVSRAVQARLQDLNKISADQAAFKAQKDLPGGKTTMRSYLWALEAEEYEANLA